MDRDVPFISGVSLERGSTAYLISPTQLDNEFNPFPTNLFRWRAKVILLRIPVRDRPEVQLKAIAYGALGHRREKWGYNRKWFGNYLTLQVGWLVCLFLATRVTGRAFLFLAACA